jgi:histidinol dehydrogenase
MRVVRGVEAGREALRRGVLRVWDDPATERTVAEILGAVRTGGDAALRDYTSRLDGVQIEALEVPAEEWRAAYRRTPRSLRDALEAVARRVRAFHELCMPKTWVDLNEGFGEMFNPVDRAGIYSPGGSGAYPSTVLMAAIPARVAGVREVVLATPPQRGGAPTEVVLAAAHVAGVDRVFQVGGAQAIAAMAYGTESVPKVDIVCGPGNIYVTLAKRMVFGEVAVDGLYGPTETVVVGDDSADPVHCAADLVAQAEHDPLASPILITTSERLLESVRREVPRQIARLASPKSAEAAFEAHGTAVLVRDVDEAVELANLYAPEHLCLLVREPWSVLRRVRNAGGVFLGDYSPEVMGDYVAGPSHVMPTGGTARFNGPLGVHDFLKVTSLVALDRESFSRLAPDGIRMARAEGFEGHRRAMRLRLQKARGESRDDAGGGGKP